MATKTSSKTATRKPAARRTAAVQKPAAAARIKLPKTKIEDKVAPTHPAAAAPTKSRTHLPSKTAPQAAPPPSREAERVSLIDRKKPRKKAEDGEVKTKHDVLPPISRFFSVNERDTLRFKIGRAHV